MLDGDNVRHGLCGDLGFAPQDRVENIRRIGEVAKLFTDAATLVLTAFISPYLRDRELVRGLLGDNNFIEIYCRCSLAICEARDVKGLYQRARAGEIKDFTGISAPYEEPVQPDLILDTDQRSLADCVDAVVRRITERGVLSDTGHAAE